MAKPEHVLSVSHQLAGLISTLIALAVFLKKEKPPAPVETVSEEEQREP